MTIIDLVTVMILVRYFAGVGGEGFVSDMKVNSYSKKITSDK